MLTTSHVTRRYLGKTAVDDMTFNVESGRIYALLGPNGSGKTTWMKMVSGLVKPTSGSILYNDQPIGVESKKRIAYMSTEPFFYSYMNVKDVGKYYEDFFKDFDRNKYDQMVQQMGFKNSDKTKTLSSGLAAKLKIAATLSRKAEVYLLDEPLNGIDIIAREHVMNYITEVLSDNVTMIISSHLVDELEKVITDVIFMKQGKLILCDDAESVRLQHQKSIVELYKEIYADIC